MDTFQPIQTFLYPRQSDKKTPDYLYWKSLQFPITTKEPSAVSHIEFCPIEPYDYAVTSSTKVEIFNSRTQLSMRTYRHFRQVAYSGSYRGDGQLMVAGGDEPVVQLFDVTQVKLQLKRNFKGHKAPVHLTRFTNDSIHLFSGSDDKSVRIWDIATESELSCFTDHQDYVRCGVASQASRDILLTGSYDHTVRLFDLRCQSSVLSIDHGFPVENVIMFPGGGLVVSAGDNFIKVWDILSGGRLLTTLSSHHKTVTSLGFCSNYQRLVSASLDRHVKFHDVNTYQVVHTLDFPSAILTVAVAPDDSLLAVGMADGLLSVQRRLNDKELAKLKDKRVMVARKQSRAKYKFDIPTYNFATTKNLTVIEHVKKTKLAKYDLFFKHFEYTKALDAAMVLQLRRKSPEITVSVMKELIRRRALKVSLAGRDEKSIKIILKFLMKNLCDQRFGATVLDVLETMIDLYQDEIAGSISLREMFQQIQSVLNTEKELAYATMELLGTLDTIMSASTSALLNNDLRSSASS
jgi:U3 small nucleolar RNA-associated protein 15